MHIQDPFIYLFILARKTYSYELGFIVTRLRPLSIKHQSRFARSAIEGSNVIHVRETGSEQVWA